MANTKGEGAISFGEHWISRLDLLLGLGGHKSSMNLSATSDYRGAGRFVQHSIIMQHIIKLSLRPEDKVLDVGCGSGEETKSIATKVSSVTAFDVSEEMISVALKYNSAPNITYIKGDARRVGDDHPEWRERFDKVVCLFVLHWIPEAERGRTLRGIIGCLKPGGEALFIIGINDPPHPIMFQARLFLKNHPKWGAYVKGFKPQLWLWDRSIADTEKLFMDCGCGIAHCEITQHELCASETELKMSVKNLLKETSLIPAAEQPSCLDDLWSWALGRYGDKSRPGYVRLSLFEVIVHVNK